MRITHGMMGDNLVNIVKRNAREMVDLQNNVATGKKARIPREDPVGVGHSILYNRALFELRQYEKNIEAAKSRMNVADSALASTTEILQRVRELAVQGANGIYTKNDRAKIAVEIEELLEELVNTANTKYKGKSVFAGNETLEDPFRATRSFSKHAGREVIERVGYFGDIGDQNREIARGDILPINVPGNEVFWAENSMLFSAVDATDYIVNGDASVMINGTEVRFKAGDNIEMVVNRINNAHVPVRASVNRMNGGIIIETSSARDIWISDIEGGSVMQDLGVIAGKTPPSNLSPAARRFGGTVFDMVQRLRDSLYMDDGEDIGTRALAGVDLALDNVLKYRAELGARSSRLDIVKARIISDQTSIEEILSRNEDIDVADAITNLKQLELAYQTALGVSARIIQPTLLDFLR